MHNYYNRLYGFRNNEEQRKKALHFTKVKKNDFPQVSEEERQKANDEYLKSTRHSWIEEKEEGKEKGETQIVVEEGEREDLLDVVQGDLPEVIQGDLLGSLYIEEEPSDSDILLFLK
jgi:hypothetical protein